MNQDLRQGCVDGKYIQERPDTTTVGDGGDEVVAKNRRTLNPLNGFMTVEHPVMVLPTDTR